MKTVNVRLMAILLGGAGALGVLFFGVHYFQVRRNAGFFLEQANIAEKQAQQARQRKDYVEARVAYEDAVKQYGWYVNLKSDDTDAIEKLGFLQADLARTILETIRPEDSPTLQSKAKNESRRATAWALNSLERALRQDAERSNARRKVVEISDTFRRYKDAIRHLEGFSETLQNDGELLFLLGKCQERTRKDDEALKSLQRAVELVPDRIEAYLLLARILGDQNRLDRPTEADHWMKQMVEANPESTQAHWEYGRYMIGLAGISSLENARQHPLLFAAMVPTVLADAVQHAIEALALADDDPDARVLAEKQEVLAAAVKRALAALDKELPLDDPDALLLNAIRGVPLGQDTPEAMAAAKDETLQALKAELPKDDYDALLLAAKHEVLSSAMRFALESFGDRRILLRARTDGVLAAAMTHAHQTRGLAGENREVLSLASKHGVFAEALKRAFGQADAADLRLTAKRPLIEASLDQAIEALDLQEDDPDAISLAAKREVLMGVLMHALGDRKLATYRLDASSQDVSDEIIGEILERAITTSRSRLEDNDRDALLLASQCSLWEKEYSSARGYIERAIEAYPSNSHMYYTLSGIELQAGHPDKAIGILRKGLEATNDAPELLWQLANLLIDSGDLEEAQQTVEKLSTAVGPARRRDVPPPAVAADYLRARIEYVQDHWRAASEGFDKVRARLTERRRLLAQAEYWLGKCYENLGNPDQALVAYRRALIINPNFSQARASAATVLGRTGQIEEALKEFQRMGPEGLLNAARILISQNLQLEPARRNWSRVEQILRRSAAENPDSITIVILRAEVLAAQERMQAAERLLRNAWDKKPQSVQLAMALASLAQIQENWEQTESILEEAEQKLGDLIALRLARAQYLTLRYKEDAADRLEVLTMGIEQFSETDRGRLLMGLARLAQQYKSWDLAEQLLDQAGKQSGAEVALRIARARYLIRRHGEEAAPEIMALAEDTGQLSEEDRLSLWEGLLPIVTGSGDYDNAKRLCGWLAEKKPNDLQVRSLLFEIAFRTNDSSGMDTVLDEIEGIEGKGPNWLFGQAVRLVLAADDSKDKRLDQALQYLDQASKARSSWARVPLLAAGIYDRKGNQEAALENYLQAISLGERNPAAIRRAAQFLARRARFAEARNVIRKLDVRSPDLNRMDMRLAWKLGNLDGALDLARTSVPLSDDFRDHIFFGQLLQEKGRQLRAANNTDETGELFAEAEKALRHGVELSEQVPSSWVALVQFFGVTGQIQKAEQTIEQIRGKIPAEELPLTLAQCYQFMDQAEKAEQHYKRALAAAPEDPKIASFAARFYLATQEPEAAQQQLERIINKEVKAEQVDVFWARRELARLFADRGDYPSRKLALALVEENLTESPSSVPDLGLKASLQGTAPARVQREQAIETLESLDYLSPEQQLRLAQSYKDQGSWTKANELMLELLGDYADQPKYVATYVDWLIDRNELHDAELWVKRLERIVPNQFGTASLQARLMFRRGQFDEALNLLRDFVNKRDALPTSLAARLRLVANSLEWYFERLKDPSQADVAGRFSMVAETLYRKYVRDNPAEQMFLISFLARRGRIDEALAELERSWANAIPDALAQTYNILLHHPSTTEAQIQRGEKIIQAALQKFDRSIPLMMIMADSHVALGNNQGALALYRDVLEKDGGHAVAMNNLALLQALWKPNAEDSLELINRAIELSGPNAPMLDTRASVFLALRQPDKALADLAAALNDDPTPVRLFHRAQAYLQKGQNQDATKAMQEAVDAGLKPESLQPLELEMYGKLSALLQ